MDIKAQITAAVEKITKDKSMLESFKKDPSGTVKQAIGVDLPDDVLSKVVDGVKAKVSLDKASGVIDSIKKLF